MANYHLRELKVELSRNCPLNCLHCSSNGEHGAPEHIDHQRISGLVKEFASMGGEKLCLSGGEPLCCNELPNIIRSGKSLGLDLSLYTTGITRERGSLKPISESTVKALAENQVKVIFSVHGANSKTHDLMTQVKGSFDNAIEAIQRVKDAGVTTEIHVVPTAINFDELVGIASLAKSLGINKISWLRFVPQGRGWINRNELKLSKGQVRQLTSIESELGENYPDIMIRLGAPLNILCPDNPASCEAGISELTISPDGHVSPCDAFKRFSLQDEYGNIYNHSLNDIWINSRFLNKIRSLHEPTLESACTACSLYSKCNSGCLAHKAIASGILAEGKDPDCPLNNEVVGDELKAVAVR